MMVIRYAVAQDIADMLTGSERPDEGGLSYLLQVVIDCQAADIFPAIIQNLIWRGLAFGALVQGNRLHCIGNNTTH